MKNAQKTTAQTFNKSVAGAMVAACTKKCLTVSGFKSGCQKVDLVKRPAKKAAAPADAMASVVESAKVVAKGKAENYSAEVTAQLLADYEASGKDQTAVETLAVKFGKTARSIVAKLSREGVYNKKVYTTKAGETPVSKEQHVKAIAAFVGVDADKLESLEKANKGVLRIIEDAVKDGATTYQNNTEDSSELKQSKQELLTNLYGWTGASEGSLESLKLASKEALEILTVAFMSAANDSFTGDNTEADAAE